MIFSGAFLIFSVIFIKTYRNKNRGTILSRYPERQGFVFASQNFFWVFSRTALGIKSRSSQFSSMVTKMDSYWNLYWCKEMQDFTWVYESTASVNAYHIIKYVVCTLTFWADWLQYSISIIIGCSTIWCKYSIINRKL